MYPRRRNMATLSSTTSESAPPVLFSSFMVLWRCCSPRLILDILLLLTMPHPLRSTVMDVGSGDPHGYWPWLSSWCAHADDLCRYIFVNITNKTSLPSSRHMKVTARDARAGGPAAAGRRAARGAGPTACTSTWTTRCEAKMNTNTNTNNNTNNINVSTNTSSESTDTPY